REGVPLRALIGGPPGEGGPPPFDDSVFRRAVLGPETRAAGLRVTVVELYEGGAVVHWHLAREDGARVDFDRHDPVALEDPLGTSYAAAESAWEVSEHGGYASGHACFAPAVPADAGHLDVVVRDANRLRIPLR
ncbi:MAG TPA: hypothetical protein VJT75_16700, partial [Thermoleophilaceae bacterium]|nr:hypothetical protein [Thermoleophilaceae bacterium]